MMTWPTAGLGLRKLLPWAAAALLSVGCLVGLAAPGLASELQLKLPELTTTYTLFGAQVSGLTLLYLGFGVCVLGLLFGLTMFNQVKAMPAYQSMLDVSNIIYETCKTYLLQQGRLLIVLELFIAVCIDYYFGWLEHVGAAKLG